MKNLASGTFNRDDRHSSLSSTTSSSSLDGTITSLDRTTCSSPSGTWYHNDVIQSLIDTLLPPIPFDNNKNGFWEYDLSIDPHYRNALQEAITSKVSTTNQFLLNTLLSTLSTSLGTSLLCSAIVTAPFHKLSRERRIELLQKLEMSQYEYQRQTFQGLKRLICGIACTYYHKQRIGQTIELQQQMLSEQLPQDQDDSDSNNNQSNGFLYHNPFWETMGYIPGPRIISTSPNVQNKENKEELVLLNSAILDHDSNPNTMNGLENEYDYIIVGSGAGGSVAAYVLSQQLAQIANDEQGGTGVSVLVIERASYIPTSELTNLESDAMDTMYQQHGLLATSDGGNVMVLAGNAIGGGTAVNWSCCLPLPTHVLNEWKNYLSKNSDITNFEYLGDDYDVALQQILYRTGANDVFDKPPTKRYHTRTNQILLAGCTKLGWDVACTGQNLQRPQDPSSGYICFGDRHNNKRSGIRAFILPAIRCNPKLRILPNCTVQRVITTTSPITNKRIATGVECYITTTQTTSQQSSYPVSNEKSLFQVTARHGVILAGGSLHTPCILQRSKVFRNKHIGKHLRLHPVAGAFGFTVPLTYVQSSATAEQRTSIENPLPNNTSEKVNCFLGAPMTTVCEEFQMGIKNDGYGYKLECPLLHPGIAIAISTWKSPIYMKQTMNRYSYLVPIIAVQRDASSGFDGGGTVRCNSKGELLIDYKIHPNDLQSLLHGVQNAIRILASDSSVVEIRTPHVRDESLHLQQRFYDDGQDDATSLQKQETELELYLQKIQDIGLKPFETVFASAHQMGTCRMSSSSTEGVVDCITGETWECSNLHLLDTSVFPTASGANPMVTVFTLSWMFASRIALLHKLRNVLSTINGISADTSTVEQQPSNDVLSKFGMSYADYKKATQLQLQQLNLRSCQKSGQLQRLISLPRQLLSQHPVGVIIIVSISIILTLIFQRI